MHRLTFEYRIYPTPAQATSMQRTLDECRWLYNRLLDERKLAWEETETSVTLYDQINRLVALKVERRPCRMCIAKSCRTSPSV